MIGPGGRKGDRGGFSLPELLLVMVLLGVLAQIAYPNYRAMVLRARAVDLVAQVRAVENAARDYQADTFQWPAEAATGVVPTGLVSYLPDGFSFTGEDYQLDWENVPIPGGLPSDPSTTRLLGVGIVTETVELGEAIVDVFGSTGRWYNVGSSFVFII
ncbi:MAG: prepilin-type N-terminal cleavage/methylation domain-containing protein, partial [Gemmatimonadota bacterium]